MDKYNYLFIFGWMMNCLGLKGNDLFIYATIFGFSHDGKSKCMMSYKELGEWAGCTPMTAIRVIDKLEKNKLIIVEQETTNGVVFNRYKADLDIVRFVMYGDADVTPYNKLLYPLTFCAKCQEKEKCIKEKEYKKIKEREDNNINIIIKEKIGEKDDFGSLLPPKQQYSLPKEKVSGEKERVSRFVAPSVDEVAEYCRERNNGIDAQMFVDFYESKGWMVGSNHMKNWKAAIRTWENKSKTNGRKTNQYSGGTICSSAEDFDHENTI